MSREPEDVSPARTLPLLLLSLVALLGMRCGHTVPRPELDDLARTYCKIALALGERDPDALDYYVGPKSASDAVHANYLSLEQTRRDAASIAEELQRYPARSEADSQRVGFMLAQLTAIEARVEMLRGVHFDFDMESRLLFQVERLPDGSAAIRRAAIARLDRALPGRRGHDLAARYEAFSRRFVVPRAKTPLVMQAALDLCRRRTLEHMALPPSEAVTVEYVSHQPWNAFSRYRGNGRSTIEINTDFPLTVDRVLELACHEGYPGHHVFNTLRDAALARTNAWPEAQVQLTFSPQSFLSEAAAAYAPRLAFSPEERVRLERDTLFPLVGLSPDQAQKYVAVTDDVALLDSALPAIAREYLDGRLEFVRAEQALEAETLMAHSEALLLYLNEYRTYMLAYTDGRRRIAGYVSASADEAERWSRYESLIGELDALSKLTEDSRP